MTAAGTFLAGRFSVNAFGQPTNASLDAISLQ